ncbi:MAG: hypothetical protein RIE32_01705 [Phycisphaerales bacterium]
MPDQENVRLTKAKRVLVTPAEEAELTKLVANIAAELGTPVKLSHLQRASLRLLHHATPQILAVASAAELQRPPNDNRDALAAFEEYLAHMLLVAYKRTPHTL